MLLSSMKFVFKYGKYNILSSKSLATQFNLLVDRQNYWANILSLFISNTKNFGEKSGHPSECYDHFFNLSHQILFLETLDAAAHNTFWSLIIFLKSDFLKFDFQIIN